MKRLFFNRRKESIKTPNKIHIGPGEGWQKPSREWIALDIDSKRADIKINLNNLKKLPFDGESVKCIYGSHVFEHVNIFLSPVLFKECYRILVKGGIIRLVLPDVRKSIEEYLRGNNNFELFKRRKERAKKLYNLDYTIFECMKEDFLSRSGQLKLIGPRALAHQNAWDFETIVKDLSRAGFKKDNIFEMSFRESKCIDFDFEGTYPSEANEEYRSIYVEAIK